MKRAQSERIAPFSLLLKPLFTAIQEWVAAIDEIT
jgi:hypothetical protein